MSLLEALQLIGYSLGAVLPLWLGYVLLRQRVGLVTVERLLLVLAGCMVGWHGGNLIVTCAVSSDCHMPSGSSRCASRTRSR